MAERCELCGARWEVGASTCRDCGSRRRITVPPQESSASMSGMAIVRSMLGSGAVPSASDSSSDVAMVRVDSSSAPFTAADASASGVPLLRDSSASTPVSAAHSSASAVPVLRDALGSAPISAAFPSALPPSSTNTLPPHVPVPPVPPPVLPSSTSTLPAAAAVRPRPSTLPPAVPTPLTDAFSQPLERPASRRGLALFGVGVAVAVAVGVGLWLTQAPPTEPAPELAPLEVHVGAASSCEQLAALAGSWVFTTATTGARRKERLGVRGFYELQIVVDGCTAHATLAKTGRTDRKAFEDEKIPRAEATLSQGEGFEAYGWSGMFVLRNEGGQGIDTRFVFALDGERLVGSWRQLGERWTTSGLYGVIEGRRDGDPVAILPERATQPCPVRCATPDDITQLDTPSQAAHAACIASCQ
jgi:hypothetical protein